MGVRNYNYAGLGYFADVGSVLLATFATAWFAWETKDTALWKAPIWKYVFYPLSSDENLRSFIRGEPLIAKCVPMRRRMFASVLLATVFWPASGQSLDQNGKSFVLGAGVSSCEQWTKARVGGGVPVDESWIEGFISSHNHYAPGPNDLGMNMTLDALRSWVDNYCSQHPGVRLVSAAEALVIELIKRRPP